MILSYENDGRSKAGPVLNLKIQSRTSFKSEDLKQDQGFVLNLNLQIPTALKL